jgi:hypothetical protein
MRRVPNPRTARRPRQGSAEERRVQEAVEPEQARGPWRGEATSGRAESDSLVAGGQSKQEDAGAMAHKGRLEGMNACDARRRRLRRGGGESRPSYVFVTHAELKNKVAEYLGRPAEDEVGLIWRGVILKDRLRFPSRGSRWVIF